MGNGLHPPESLIPSVLCVIFQPHWVEITFPRYTFSQYLKACLCKYQELLGLPAAETLDPE